MKKSALLSIIAATFAFGGMAQAGSLADPVVDPVVIVDDATSSSSGTTLVLALALLLSVPAFTD